MDSGARRRNKGKKAANTKAQPKQSAAKRSSWSQFLSVLAVMVVAFGIVLYVLPSPIDPIPVYMPPAPAFEGPLTPNNLLQKTERLFKGMVLGPETMAFRDGAIYTGTSDGRVIKIEGERVTTVVERFGSPPCGEEKYEHSCGRPLGLRFHTDGFLYVLDAYLGIFKVDVKAGESKKLLSADDSRIGKPMKLLNDLDITSDGTIYFSDSSYRWTRRENRHIAMENARTGRVFKFNLKTGDVSLVIDKLCFPNGIQLSPDESFFLVAETNYANISRYYLKGPKKGQLETFAENLPGLVDNIRPRKAGGYWLGIAAIRKQPFALYDFMVARPWMAKLFSKLFDPGRVIVLMPKYGLAVALDQDGRIVQSLHDPTGQQVPSVSQVLDTGEYLYFGSYYSDFLGRLDQSKLK